MEHFYKNIGGVYFNFEDFYKNIVAPNMVDGDHIVEIGGWDGKSVSFLGVEIANSNKAISYDVIVSMPDGDSFNTFIQNTDPVKNYFNLIRSSESDVAASCEDNSLSLVFLDNVVSEQAVTASIQTWLPKVKTGGILAGDDYGEVDWPGVKNAVNANLAGFSVIGTTWIYVKN